MKLYMFRTVRLSITRIYSLYTQQWYMSYRFIESFREGPGWKVRKLESCLQTSMTYSIAKCAVNKLLMMDRCETCTVSWQNKICKTGASSWFYYKEICYDARSHERKISDVLSITKLLGGCWSWLSCSELWGCIQALQLAYSWNSSFTKTIMQQQHDMTATYHVTFSSPF